MISKNIINSISPLKARKGKGVAGKVGMKATATEAQTKAGLTPSGTVPSGKGYMTNLESLTAGTRLTSSLADALKERGPGGQPKDDFGETGEFGDVKFQTTPDIEEGSGNRFYDACHTADGKRKPSGSTGTTTWTEIDKKTGKEVTKSKSFKCEWDPEHVSTGAHDYRTNLVKGEHQYSEKQAGSDEWSPWKPVKGTKYEKK